MGLLSTLIYYAVEIYIIAIVVQIALHWLIAFDVVNAGNAQAQNLIRLLKRATDPVFTPLRRFIPPIAGFDLTPVVVIIGLSILRNVVIGFLAGAGL